MSDLDKEIAELLKQDAKIETDHTEARKPQQITDLKRLVALKTEHGADVVCYVELSRYKPGAATMVIALLPASSEFKYKRFQQTTHSDKAKSGAKLEAGEQLARSCMIYPHPKDDEDLHEATVEFAPGILGHLAHSIVKAVQGRDDEQGK